MSGIQLVDLSKVFGSETKEQKVLSQISFSVADRSFTAIVGPSGCGKSTLLNIIAGIEQASRGSIIFPDGKESSGDVTIGYVFQSPRLLNWLSVLDNVLFVKPKDTDANEFEAIARHYLDMVGLNAQDIEKFPLQLSGGMQQRVGIARALSVEPDVLLMDEPFSHLDAITATKLRREVMRIWQETRKTILFVTHDLEEALEMGDRMLVLGKEGKILDDLEIALSRPRSLTDEEFVGFYAQCNKRFLEVQTSQAHAGA